MRDKACESCYKECHMVLGNNGLVAVQEITPRKISRVWSTPVFNNDDGPFTLYLNQGQLLMLDGDNKTVSTYGLFVPPDRQPARLFLHPGNRCLPRILDKNGDETWSTSKINDTHITLPRYYCRVSTKLNISYIYTQHGVFLNDDTGPKTFKECLICV